MVTVPHKMVGLDRFCCAYILCTVTCVQIAWSCPGVPYLTVVHYVYRYYSEGVNSHLPTANFLHKLIVKLNIVSDNLPVFLKQIMMD